MTEPVVELVTPAPPASNGAGHACPECGLTFSRPQGLGRHRLSAHNVPGKTRTTTRPRPPKLDRRHVELALAEDGYDPWIIVLGGVEQNLITARALVLSTKTDVDQVAGLLAELGHHPFVFRVADAATP